MRITVDHIPERGVDISVGAGDAWAGAAAGLACEHPPETIDARLHVARVADCVRVTGELRARFHASCDRCQAAIEVTLEGPVDLFYSSAPPGVPDEETGLEEGDLDIGWFDGVALDLGLVVSEQLALWLPERLLCDGAGVRRLEGGDPCELPAFDGGPDLSRQSPFARLRLPE